VDVLGARAGLTLAVDPLGNGLSDKPHDPDAYAWPAVAADVVAGIDAAGVERAAVWGYSRGAALAGAIAAGFPDRVAALILSGGGDLSHVTPKGTPASTVSEAMYRGDFGPLWERFSFSEADGLYDTEFNDPKAFGAMGIGGGRSGMAIDLGRVTAPAFVYVGGNDEPDEEKKTADALGADLHVVSDLDHLQGFSGVDLIMPLVLGFLESLGL